MATLHADDITDLVNLTQNDLGRMKLTEIATDLQEHVAMSRMMRRNRMTFDSGRNIVNNALVEAADNTRNTGLFDVDNVNQTDGTIAGSVPWRYTTTGSVFDVRQVAMNRGPAKIVDFSKTKRYQMLIDLAEHFEGDFWTEPESSTDVTSPFGIRYWLVYNATEGFNGANNTNFAAGPAGISRTTYPRWKNWTAKYTNVTKDDLVRKVRKAMRYCDFRPVISNPPVPDYARRHSYGLYSTYSVVAACEELAEAQNDSLGNDLASRDGRVTIRRAVLEDVPFLTNNDATSSPVVGIDWGVFQLVAMSGEWMRLTPYHQAPEQHNVRQSFLDCMYNYRCTDCRRMFLIALASWH